MATHSSTLAWKIPWTEKPGRLQSMGFPWDSAGKDSSCNVGDLGSIPGLGRSPGEGKVPTPVFWLGEFHGVYSLWGCKESVTTERLSLSLYSNGNTYICTYVCICMYIDSKNSTVISHSLTLCGCPFLMSLLLSNFFLNLCYF